jgi:hypothetical protein
LVAALAVLEDEGDDEPDEVLEESDDPEEGVEEPAPSVPAAAEPDVDEPVDVVEAAPPAARESVL